MDAPRAGLRQRVFAWALARFNARYERFVSQHKRRLFADVTGTLLEIGPGTGVNLRYLVPDRVRWMGVEPNPFMLPYLCQEANRVGIPVETRISTRRQLGGPVWAMIHVDPDADDDVIHPLVCARRLGQDPRDLAALDQYVVGPFELSGHAGNLLDRLRHPEAGDQREQWYSGRQWLGSQQNRSVEAEARRGGPRASSATPPGCLPIGENRKALGPPGAASRHDRIIRGTDFCHDLQGPTDHP